MLTCLLLGAAAGFEIATHQADVNLLEQSQRFEQERQSWQQERAVLQDRINEMVAAQAAADPAPQNGAAQVDGESSLGQKDDGHLIPEITQPGAKSYAEQQAEAAARDQQTRAVAGAVLRELLK